MCMKNQMWDGQTCRTEYYMHMNPDNIERLELSIRNKSVMNTATLEFWILLLPNKVAGYILSFNIGATRNVTIKEESFAYWKLYTYDSGALINIEDTVEVRTPQTSTSNWHKISILLSK